MARRRTAKGNVKRHSTNNIFAIAQRMETDFMGTPMKMSAHLNKQIGTLRQKESKLKNALNKSKSQTKNSLTRIKAASKKKNTTAGKKQIAKFKKSHAMLIKNQTTLDKQLQDTSKLLTTATTRHAKAAALRKHLSQFEKEWSKNEKKLKAKSKTKTKSKRKTTSKSRPFPQSKQQQQQQQQGEPFERVDELKIDEEVTS